MASPDRYTRRGNYVVRRPVHAERPPETWGEAVRRHWPEIVGGLAVLLVWFLVIAWLLPAVLS